MLLLSERIKRGKRVSSEAEEIVKYSGACNNVFVFKYYYVHSRHFEILFHHYVLLSLSIRFVQVVECAEESFLCVSKIDVGSLKSKLDVRVERYFIGIAVYCDRLCFVVLACFVVGIYVVGVVSLVLLERFCYAVNADLGKLARYDEVMTEEQIAVFVKVDVEESILIADCVFDLFNYERFVHSSRRTDNCNVSSAAVYDVVDCVLYVLGLYFDRAIVSTLIANIVVAVYAVFRSYIRIIATNTVEAVLSVIKIGVYSDLIDVIIDIYVTV